MALRFLLPTATSRPSQVLSVSFRSLSSFSSKGGSKKNFRPRRRPNPSYRPLVPSKKAPKPSDLKANANNFMHFKDDPRKVGLEDEDGLGDLANQVIQAEKERRSNVLHNVDEVEDALRWADYFTSEQGSTEDLVGSRRLLSGEDFSSDEEREEFVAKIDAMLEQQQFEDVLRDEREEEEILKSEATKERIPTDPLAFEDEDDASNEGEMDHDVYLDPNQLAHGEWSEQLITVDRTTKLWRGGRLESYRALVIGGNLNGCGGFGIGKSADPLQAVDLAGRKCKRNIFFVDRYQGSGLTRDLVGRQNSCKVILRATDNGLRGNELCREILKRFGITNCVAKSHGNRNPYNVVRATFKALLTHESINDIALKRGKRIVSIDRAMRMQV